MLIFKLINTASCTYTYHLSHLKVVPQCNVDGTFASKQCKGDKISGRSV